MVLGTGPHGGSIRPGYPIAFPPSQTVEKGNWRVLNGADVATAHCQCQCHSQVIPNACINETHAFIYEDPFADMEEQLRRFSLCQLLTPEQISGGFHARAKLIHPDKCVIEEDIQLANQAFPKVKKARDVLGNPERRAEYDRSTVAKLREQLLEFRLTSMRLNREEAEKSNYASADESFL